MPATISTDGYVQVAADGVGKKIDNTEITRADNAGTVVERQRVAIPDGIVVGGPVLSEMLIELRAIRIGLALLLDVDPSSLIERNAK